jgi:hypothetical protein
MWALICLLLLVEDFLSGSRLKLQFFLAQAVQPQAAWLDKLLRLSSESLTQPAISVKLLRTLSLQRLTHLIVTSAR